MNFTILLLFLLLFLYLSVICLLNTFKNKVDYKKEFLNFCIFISVLLIISQTLFPIRPGYTFEGFEIYNLIPFKVPYEIYKNYSFSYFLYQVLGNIIMFVPYGYFLYLRTNNNKPKTILIALATTLLIEFIQGFIPYRFCEIDDIWLNTLGAYIGLTIPIVLTKLHKQQIYNKVN